MYVTQILSLKRIYMMTLIRFSMNIQPFFGFHRYLIPQIPIKHDEVRFALSVGEFNLLNSRALGGCLSISASCHPNAMGSSGLEPPTSRLSGARSNQLSYEPLKYEDRAAFL